MATENNPDVKLAFDTIVRKRALYDELHKYYAGLHPLKYSSSKLSKVFERLDAFFVENWVGVVIDAVIERLVLNGFDISKDDNAKIVLDDLWRDYDINLIADDVHESCGIVSEAFVIAAKMIDEETEQEELQIYFNDARLCHMFYDEEQPNIKRFAAKMWQDIEGYTRLTLFYYDRYEHYRSRTPNRSSAFALLSGLLSFVLSCYRSSLAHEAKLQAGCPSLSVSLQSPHLSLVGLFQQAPKTAQSGFA